MCTVAYLLLCSFTQLCSLLFMWIKGRKKRNKIKEIISRHYQSYLTGALWQSTSIQHSISERNFFLRMLFAPEGCAERHFVYSLSLNEPDHFNNSKKTGSTGKRYGWTSRRNFIRKVAFGLKSAGEYSGEMKIFVHRSLIQMPQWPITIQMDFHHHDVTKLTNQR